MTITEGGRGVGSCNDGAFNSERGGELSSSDVANS